MWLEYIFKSKSINQNISIHNVHIKYQIMVKIFMLHADTYTPFSTAWCGSLQRSIFLQWLQDRQITSGRVYEIQGSFHSASGENSPIFNNFRRSLLSLHTC